MSFPKYALMPYYRDFTFSPPAIPEIYWDAYSQEARLKLIMETLDYHRQYMDNQTDAMNGYTEGLTALRDAFDDLKSDYKQFRTGLEQRYSEFEETFRSLKNEVDNTVSELRAEHKNLDTKINNSLKEWKNELNAFRTEFANSLSEYDKRLQALTNQQNIFESKQNQFQNRLDGFSTRMDTLESDMDALQDKWEKEKETIEQQFKDLENKYDKLFRQLETTLKTQIKNLQKELRDEVTRLDKTLRNQFKILSDEVDARVDAGLEKKANEFKTYSDAQDKILYLRLYTLIRAMQIKLENIGDPSSVNVNDPTQMGGQSRNVNEVIHDSYDWLRYFGLTARGQYYYSRYWTAQDYADLGLTARDYDTGGLFYLGRKHWKYEFSPVTGKWQETQRNLADLATLHGDRWNAAGFDEEGATAADLDGYNWDAFYYDFYNYLGDVKKQWREAQEAKDTEQDGKISEIETVNTQQSSSIEQLETRVSALEI